METQTRRRVWQEIRTRPGLNKSELVRRTGLSWGAVDHHLDMLEQDGAIRMIHIGRTVHATPTGFAKRLERIPTLVCPDTRRVLETLLAQPSPCGTTELGRLLGRTRKQVRRHVQELMYARLVQSDGSYHPLYRVTRRGRAAAGSLAALDVPPREAEATTLRPIVPPTAGRIPSSPAAAAGSWTDLHGDRSGSGRTRAQPRIPARGERGQHQDR